MCSQMTNHLIKINHCLTFFFKNEHLQFFPCFPISFVTWPSVSYQAECVDMLIIMFFFLESIPLVLYLWKGITCRIPQSTRVSLIDCFVTFGVMCKKKAQLYLQNVREQYVSHNIYQQYSSILPQCNFPWGEQDLLLLKYSFD